MLPFKYNIKTCMVSEVVSISIPKVSCLRSVL
nr:MAG TPA: hypothetical protein [Bacteriophage sp.]